jgi:hypothetical protein
MMFAPSVPFWITYVGFGLIGLFDPGRFGRLCMVIFLVASIDLWKYYEPDAFLAFFTKVP